MERYAPTIAAALALFTVVVYGGEDKRRDRDQRTLQTLKARATRIGKRPAGTDALAAFLAIETDRLITRIDPLPGGSYELRRLLEALDDLLDAREDILDARQTSSRKSEDDDDDDNRDGTARRLERAYFRVQQGGYFGKLSGDPSASEYILRSRQLYQQARGAYDRQEYRQASKLAEASTELVNVLENLAQAAVRRPEPPVLK